MLTLLPHPQSSPANVDILDSPGLDLDDWIGDDLYVEPVDLDVPADIDFFSLQVVPTEFALTCVP